MIALITKLAVPVLLATHTGLTWASKSVSADDLLVRDTPRTGNIPYTLSTERTFLLNVPAAYKHGEPLPLVLSFHGAGGSSKKQQHITQLSDPSLSIAGKPFLTVYPQGVNNTDAGKTHVWMGAPYSNTTVDDIGFVYDIISNVSATYSVDRSRIYANGKSNGGGFTALMACRPDTSSVFAAFAPVSPALYKETDAFHNCTPSRPVPIFHTHGIEDTVAPFYGRSSEISSSRAEPDVRVWRRQWAVRNGCVKGQDAGKLAPKPSRVQEVHKDALEEFWDCPGAEVRALSVEGLGHSWPTTLGLDLAGSPNQTANFNLTSQHLVQFYSQHSLDQ